MEKQPRNKLGNLVPFTGASDPRRQNGRRRGQINRKTAIRNLLTQEVDPKFLFTSRATDKLVGMKDKTYLEVIIYTLINQSLGGDTRASDLLLRELRYADQNSQAESPFTRDIRIEVVGSCSATDGAEKHKRNDGSEARDCFED